MKLRDPQRGTVIRLGEAQAARYLARGWVDADKAPEPKPAPVEKPAPTPAPKRRGRPPTNKK